MRIIIVYTEIKETDDDDFKPRSEKIILQSTIPFTHFHERYDFKILFPEPVKGSWKRIIHHKFKAKPFQLLEEVGRFLASAVDRIKE